MMMYGDHVERNPFLYRFLKALPDRVSRRPQVLKAFKTYTTRLEEVALKSLSWETLPWVVPAEIGERYGHYDPGVSRDTIFLEHTFEWLLHAATQFTGITWRQGGELKRQFNAQPAAELLVEAKVLHEIVHYLDYTADNQHLGGEAGNAFEKAAYGKVLKHVKDPQFASIKSVFPEYF